jgi:uncharacterized protein YndB with AHSA1/START domain
VDEVSVAVDAPPERVWALVTDITKMGRWSPECTGGEWRSGARGPAVGAKFVGRNQRGLMRWTTHCTVTAAAEPTHFEWRVFESGMRWGYRFEPSDGGRRTIVTEYREHSRPYPVFVKWVVRTGLLGRDREKMLVDGMRETLERVKAAAEAR